MDAQEKVSIVRWINKSPVFGLNWTTVVSINCIWITYILRVWEKVKTEVGLPGEVERKLVTAAFGTQSAEFPTATQPLTFKQLMKIRGGVSYICMTCRWIHELDY